MKKNSKVLLLISFIFFIFTLTSCLHQHDWKEIKREDVTCVSDGKITYCCFECDEIKVVTFETAKGHVEVIDNAVDATCISTGLTAGKHCSNCGEIFQAQQTIPAKGHSYSSGSCTSCGEIDSSYYAPMTIEEALQKENNTKVCIEGTVVFVETGWSSFYNNLSVIILDEYGDYILVYRLKTKVEYGDIIAVKGVIGTYNGSKQISSGGTAEVIGHDSFYSYKEMSISEVATASQSQHVIVKGIVEKIDVMYNEKYDNNSVYITDGNGNSLYLRSLLGAVKVGQYIQVKGTVSNYNGTNEVINGELQIIETATVTWANWDGTILETDSYVIYGDMPSYDGEEPTRALTEQYHFEFAGWDKTVAKVTGDVTYIATFNSTLRTFTVTWANWDGTILEQDSSVSYNDMPSYDGEEPTRDSTEQYHFEFKGWNETISNVTSDVVYTATFTEVVRIYTVIWKNWDGTILEIDENVVGGTPHSYDGEVPSKPANTGYKNQFDGWAKEVIEDSSNIIYIAKYIETNQTFVVTWTNWDGTVLKTDSSVEYGKMPQYTGPAPVRESTKEYIYDFSGWDKELVPVVENVVYIAVFVARENKIELTIDNYSEYITLSATMTNTKTFNDYGDLCIYSWQNKYYATGSSSYHFYDVRITIKYSTSMIVWGNWRDVEGEYFIDVSLNGSGSSYQEITVTYAILDSNGNPLGGYYPAYDDIPYQILCLSEVTAITGYVKPKN